MCIEPPLPRQTPPSRPNSSANIAAGGVPAAIVWPWLRWVVENQSPSSSAANVPAGIASMPTDRCREPCRTPSFALRSESSSNSRIVTIVR